MLYPGRIAAYTDRRQFLSNVYERENIWSWASEPIRRYHAAYRRPRYFDMRRWPPSRQDPSTQQIIQTRADEDPKLQPASAKYKYGIVVGPNSRNSLSGTGSTGSTRLTRPTVSTLPRQVNSSFRTNNNISSLFTSNGLGSSTANAMDKNTDLGTGHIPAQTGSFIPNLDAIPGFHSLHDQDKNMARMLLAAGANSLIDMMTRASTQTRRAPARATTGRAPRMPNQLTNETTTVPGVGEKWTISFKPPRSAIPFLTRPQMQAIRRKDEIFIPGPIVFPMGDTLLSQVNVSLELEKGKDI
jgi:hypothetical protein